MTHTAPTRLFVQICIYSSSAVIQKFESNPDDQSFVLKTLCRTVAHGDGTSRLVFPLYELSSGSNLLTG